MSIKGIILAAGRGSRMGSATDFYPKCLVQFQGKPLLEHQLAAFNQAGIQDIALVTGYKSSALDSYKVQTFHNDFWQTTNIVGSLACAYEWLGNFDCVVSYSDIFYCSDIVSALVHSQDDISVAYDPEWLTLWQARFSDPLSDAETFKLGADRYLLEIGKKTKSYEDIQGQYMGLLKFKKTVWDTVNLNNYSQSDMTSFLQGLIEKKILIKAIENKSPWAEIDSLTDLNAYSRRDILHVG